MTVGAGQPFSSPAVRGAITHIIERLPHNSACFEIGGRSTLRREERDDYGRRVAIMINDVFAVDRINARNRKGGFKFRSEHPTPGLRV
jgi:hypothetical protein